MTKPEIKSLLFDIEQVASRHNRACDNVEYLRGDLDQIARLIAKWEAENKKARKP